MAPKKSYPHGDGNLCKLERVSIFGKVNKNSSSYLIRWKLLPDNDGYSKGSENRYLTITHQTSETWLVAHSRAVLINHSLLIGNYSDSLWFPEKYKKEEEKKLTLLDVWEDYKKLKTNSTSKTTQTNSWRQVDNILRSYQYQTDINNKLLNELIKEALTIYCYSTLERTLTELNSALHCYDEYKNLNIKGLLKKHSNLKTSRGTSNKVFSKDELKNILLVFNDSPYFNYVYFLMVTGCRPNEVTTLLTTDIKNINNKIYLIIKDHKNNRYRDFPLNNLQLKELIEKCFNVCHEFNSTVLVSNKGNKINHKNFTVREWKPKINFLVSKGLIKEYLPPYNLRHTWITNALNQTYEGKSTGQIIKDVAYLAGTSQDMIFKHYQGMSEVLEVPEFNF